MSKKFTIEIQGYPVRIRQTQLGEYICITDIARISKEERPSEIIRNYLRNQSNLEFLALWELHYNPKFNVEGFERFKNSINKLKIYFISSVRKWKEETNSIGFISRAGRYGGIDVHTDIAIHFTTWFDAKSYFHLTREIQRLKEAEQNLLNNPTKIPLEEIIAEANRMREAEKDKSEKTGEEEE